MVNGSRYMGGNGRNTPIYRWVGQTVLDKATYLNSGLKIMDTRRLSGLYRSHNTCIQVQAERFRH
jgi:hypothetical protein